MQWFSVLAFAVSDLPAFLRAVQGSADSAGGRAGDASSDGWIIPVAGLFVTILTAIITYLATKTSAQQANVAMAATLRTLQAEHRRQEKECERLRREVAKAAPLAERYVKAREILERSFVVQSHHQPVLLLGPKGVGKTSLLMQWHAPWSNARLDPTEAPWSAEVPIHHFENAKRAPHFADSDITTRVKTHLLLRVHDFPGELSAQHLVRERLFEEAQRLNATLDTRLGLVLVCMFDASEAHSGISHDTRDYYNGEMFRNLRLLVQRAQVHVSRIVLVFNKHDLLREAVGDTPGDDLLLDRCLRTFHDIYGEFASASFVERRCSTFTVLSRERMREKNRGAPIVLGEAAREIVAAFAGEGVANTLIRASATPVPERYYGAPPIY